MSSADSPNHMSSSLTNYGIDTRDVTGTGGGSSSLDSYSQFMSNHGPGDVSEVEDSLTGGGTSENDQSDGGEKCRPRKALREQDRFLPIANVARIMKVSIPRTGKIAKDAKECVQECVSEFVSFITSEASDRCHTEKRKTINGEDILFAMQSLGFDNYVNPLKAYLHKYREAMKGDKPGQPGQETALGASVSFDTSNLREENSANDSLYLIQNSQVTHQVT